MTVRRYIIRAVACDRANCDEEFEGFAGQPLADHLTITQEVRT